MAIYRLQAYDACRIVLQRKVHLARLANLRGSIGEAKAIALATDWIERPKGMAVKNLLGELAETGIRIKPSSFDAIATTKTVDFSDCASIRAALPHIVFIEIKMASQSRVKPGFGGFFLALTENEISAAEQLGERHKVALFSKQTGELQITLLADLLMRARSSTWQVSIQL